MKWDGSAWNVVGSAGISTGAAVYQSLQVINANEIYVAYSGSKTTVMKWE